MWSLMEVLWTVGSFIWKSQERESTLACCVGGVGSVPESGWTKTGGEILESVGGGLESEFAVCQM